ncbi:Protein FAN [Trichoplax sp. H2]|nr:Protein FAN [Trichoplax sp. H2]|eukprot:RDD47132.1 Protein FAN [Trichoplax sp. H2]
MADYCYKWYEADVRTKRPERFSLLLLQPNEIYFEDFSVYYYPIDLPEHVANERKQIGRLKVCSKSLVYEPQDTIAPLLRFDYKQCEFIDKWSGSLYSKIDRSNVIAVNAFQVIELKEGNKVTPYNFRKQKGFYLFSLNYVSINVIIPFIQQLWRAATLPRAEQDAMISAIVHSRLSRLQFDRNWFDYMRYLLHSAFTYKLSRVLHCIDDHSTILYRMNDIFENIVLETTVERINPLNCTPGRIVLSPVFLYFQPFNNIDADISSSDEKGSVLKCKLSNITRIQKKRYMLTQVGIEIYSSTEDMLLFLALSSEHERNHFYDIICSQKDVQLEDSVNENATLRWQNGFMSNFDYLMHLNRIADRSFNDLTQYPVFPWVIADYYSEELDLEDPKTFRDLSKPVGALNQDRLSQLKERYDDMPEPKFLYGSHYSAPGYILFYLVRVAPEYMLCLQNGRFDAPDRSFHSIAGVWQNVLSGFSDFKELIPEFYASDGEFLKNSAMLPLGVRSDNSTIDDVVLPKWARDHSEFTKILREALECDYVSEHLHSWIDLIFGFKQTGYEAIKANNVFHYLTYEGSIDLSSVNDPNERASLKLQILEFGQTPRKIFDNPHPQRNITKPLGPGNIVNMPAVSIPSEQVIDLIATVTDNKSKSDENDTKMMTYENLSMVLCRKLHKNIVTGICLSDNGNQVFSVSQDQYLRAFYINENEPCLGYNISGMPLSSCDTMVDGKSLIVGSYDNNIYLYSIEFGSVLDTIEGHCDAVSCLCRRGNVMVSGSWDCTVKIWELSDEGGSQEWNLSDEFEEDVEVSCIDLSVNKTLLVSGSKSGSIFIWSLKEHTLTNEFRSHDGAVNAVAFSPDNHRILSSGDDNFLKVLDLDTGMEVLATRLNYAIRCYHWNGAYAVCGDVNGNLNIWDMLTGTCLQTVKGHDGAIECLDVNEDNNVIVTGGEDKAIIVWNYL